MSTELLMIVSNAITGVAAWFVGRRKSNAETDNIILLGLEQSVSIYRDVVESLKLEIERLNMKIDQLESKIEELIKENQELKGNRKEL